MNSLRFLLVHRSQRQSDAIAALLAQRDHSVLPTTGLAEAADALTVERFDAILLESEFRTRGLKEFSEELRHMALAQRGTARIPVIGLAPLHLCNAEPIDPESGLDAIMPEPIDAEALTEATLKLAEALQNSAQGLDRDDRSLLSILEPEMFKEQVGFDTELMVEIIDLFLVERQRQEPEMREALMASDFELLCRLAHTIKGSLSSLHAMRAKAHAQDLEQAAKHGDENICWQSLAALEADLIELEPELMALRAS